MTIKDLTGITKSLNGTGKDALYTVLGDPDAKSQDVERIPSGVLSLDIPLGGGVPVGRILEIYGPESSGKTTAALHMAAGFQRFKKDKAIAFMDYEHAFDPEYAKALGIDPERFVLAQPSTMEQGLQGVDDLIETGKFSMIIIDSVAAMVPAAELAGEMGKSSVGVQARGMSQALRKIVGKAYKTGTTLIFLNQLREKIGVMFGNPETTSGGNALKFYASIRIDIRRGKVQNDKEGEALSNRGRLKVVKNKTYPPYKKSEFDIGFGTGISAERDLLDYGTECGLFTKKGSWYYYFDETAENEEDRKITLGNGAPASVEFLALNKEFAATAIQIIVDSLL